MTAEDDISIVARQLAELTATVQGMQEQLTSLREQAERQQERSNKQQGRTETQQRSIDLAARELADVIERLQAAADALRTAL